MQLSAAKTITTDRGRFAYREAGEPTAPALVLLHGWPESSYCWQPLVQRLNSRLRIIAPDLRGLGESTRDGDLAQFQKQALAADIIDLLDAIGVVSFQLAGHDWGGVVAQEIALAIPTRVQRLVLLNITIINNARGNMEAVAAARSRGGPFYWYQHFQQQADLPEAMIPGNEEVWLSYFLRNWNRQPFPPDALAEYIRCYRIPGTPGAAANYYRAMREDTKRWATLADHVWPMPSLYIYGNRDPVIIPETLNHIDSCFADIRVEQIEAGHFVQEEQPEQVAYFMSAFLQT